MHLSWTIYPRSCMHIWGISNILSRILIIQHHESTQKIVLHNPNSDSSHIICSPFPLYRHIFCCLDATRILNKQTWQYLQQQLVDTTNKAAKCKTYHLMPCNYKVLDLTSGAGEDSSWLTDHSMQNMPSLGKRCK